DMGVPVSKASHWAEGSAGTEELANKVVALAEAGPSKYAPLYNDDMPLWDKISTIATEIYRASEVTAASNVRAQIKQYQDEGYGHYPICVAKTQYSFSTDPALMGAPDNHSVNVREVRLAAGAEFLVAICGDIMTMPGLPSVPSAEKIMIDDDGLVQGLF
nr:formate--tetrahydrofolate ligase [Alphaproteobacteria bacterium]